jgi:hypothetical protein
VQEASVSLRRWQCVVAVGRGALAEQLTISAVKDEFPHPIWAQTGFGAAVPRAGWLSKGTAGLQHWLNSVAYQQDFVTMRNVTRKELRHIFISCQPIISFLPVMG